VRRCAARRSSSSHSWWRLLSSLRASETTFQNARAFRRVAFGIFAGPGFWSLSSQESFLDTRADTYVDEGFDLHGADFQAAFSYGVEIQVRVADRWYVRTTLDRSQYHDDVRDRSTMMVLGGRHPVSLTYDTRTESRPFLFTFGAGRTWDIHALRMGVTLGTVVAPVELEETYEIILDTASKSVQRAEGWGIGLESAVSFDYYTDARMTLFTELVGRLGSTNVELDDPDWESINIPNERNVDFTGITLRLGVRWI
jgi:hypothetical protein